MAQLDTQHEGRIGLSYFDAAGEDTTGDHPFTVATDGAIGEEGAEIVTVRQEADGWWVRPGDDANNEDGSTPARSELTITFDGGEMDPLSLEVEVVAGEAASATAGFAEVREKAAVAEDPTEPVPDEA